MDRAKLPAKSSTLLKQFDDNISLYRAFCGTIEDLIKRLLNTKGISVHSISSRCKDRVSFEKKLSRKARYRALVDVTDLAGIRIITHYADDVDIIAKVIEDEFLVDRVNSIDKRVVLDPDRFGYLSLHYVASLKSTRTKLQEYSDYKDLKVEVQIRSILQHTWAEIEHDIGYKNEIEVPGPIKRKFSRLAGLLELADQEFNAIRVEITKYAKSLDKKMASGNKGIGLDAVSFEKFVRLSPVSLALDARVCELGGYNLGEYKPDSKVVNRLAGVGINTIEMLSELLVRHQAHIERMVEGLRDLPSEGEDDLDSDPSPMGLGISSFYLLHVLAAKLDRESIVKYLEENDWLRAPGGEEFLDLLDGFFEA